MNIVLITAIRSSIKCDISVLLVIINNTMIINQILGSISKKVKM